MRQPSLTTLWKRSTAPMILGFYQFTQPFVVVSPFFGHPLDFFERFSVRLPGGQVPHNAAHGYRASSRAGPPNGRAGDPTDPLPVACRPPRWPSTATRPARPNGSAAPALGPSTHAASPWRRGPAPPRRSSPPATAAGTPAHPPHSSGRVPWGPRAGGRRRRGQRGAPPPAGRWGTLPRAAEARAGSGCALPPQGCTARPPAPPLRGRARDGAPRHALGGARGCPGVAPGHPAT